MSWPVQIWDVTRDMGKLFLLCSTEAEDFCLKGHNLYDSKGDCDEPAKETRIDSLIPANKGEFKSDSWYLT